MQYLSDSHHQTYPQGHAQLPQMNRCGQIKFLHYMMKADVLVLMPVLCKQNQAANQLAYQSQQAAANQRLSHNRIARQVDIRKAV